MKQDVEPADQAARPEGAKAMTSYLLDNASPQAAQRFAGLEACYDHSTFALLSALGLTDGWRCWEIGAGGGSVRACNQSRF